MRRSAFTTRHLFARRALLRRVLPLGLIVSLMMVFSAPVWHSHLHDHHHHHDDATEHEDECPVCIAVMAPTGDGLPDLPLLDLPAVGGLVRWMGAERLAVLWVGRDRASRGPPV